MPERRFATDKKAVKRRAWTYRSEPAPELRALWGRAEQRRRFLRYWLWDNIGNATDIAFHFVLKLLPMDLCSEIGARLGRFAFPRWHKPAIARAQANIEELRPDLDLAGRQALLKRNWAHQGRLMTEFSIVNRIVRSKGRVTYHDMHYLRQAAADGAAIIVGMHLGNWEISGSVLASMNIHPYATYAPPPQRGRAWIARRVREQAGIHLVPPGRDGVRALLGALKNGKPVALFCDEGFGGRIRGPLFGRRPHLEGNLAAAVRLAYLTGAAVYPCPVLRQGEALRFSVTALPPLTFDRGADRSEGRLLADIARLNDAIEPVVRANLEQWYFLDNQLDPY